MSRPAYSDRTQEIRMLLASRSEAERAGDRAAVEYCDRQLAALRAEVAGADRAPRAV